MHVTRIKPSDFAIVLGTYIALAVGKAAALGRGLRHRRSRRRRVDFCLN
jgi:hypothetical protein